MGTPALAQPAMTDTQRHTLAILQENAARETAIVAEATPATRFTRQVHALDVLTFMGSPTLPVIIREAAKLEAEGKRPLVRWHRDENSHAITGLVLAYEVVAPDLTGDTLVWWSDGADDEAPVLYRELSSMEQSLVVFDAQRRKYVAGFNY